MRRDPAKLGRVLMPFGPAKLGGVLMPFDPAKLGRVPMVPRISHRKVGMRMKEKGMKTLMGLLLVLALPVVAMGVAAIVMLHMAAGGGMSETTAMIVMIVLMVIVVGLIFVCAKWIAGSLAKVAGSLGDIADGTLDMDENMLADRNDAIGRMMRSVREMVKSFAKVVTGINKATDALDLLSGDFGEAFDNMTTAMEQVSEAVGIIAGNTASQADKTVDIEDKVMQISQAIDVIAGNVDVLTKSADKMKECNLESEKIMRDLVHISSENGAAIENVRSQTDLTNQSAQEIRQATEIIAGIANQTNLLALNASIEAARAGEMGKGFAVVAEEIRTLADQSRESSEHISKIVNNLIENSNDSVEITCKVSEAFVQQNEKIRETEGIFTQLNHEITSVSTSIIGISREVESLESHKDVIKEGIVTLTEAAEQNTASAQETLGATNEVGQMVENCRTYTGQITEVTKELVGNISKINTASKKGQDLLNAGAQ